MRYISDFTIKKENEKNKRAKIRSSIICDQISLQLTVYQYFHLFSAASIRLI
jgi:hypothetical protein